MILSRSAKHLIDDLPQVEGQLEADASLSNLIWFRTGGKAEVLFRPKNEADLIYFLQNLEPFIPVTMLGVGSNLLVRDGGVDGVVIRLGKPFAHIEQNGNEITAGAGAVDVTVSNCAVKVGLAGLEFLRGIPGTIGGAVVMNAGAYGSDVSERIVKARFLDRNGNVHVLDKAEMGYSYRHSNIDPSWIVLDATFRCVEGDRDEIQARMDKIYKTREETQPMRTRTGGSSFKNPNHGQKDALSAWQLIDDAGCRGMHIRGAQVSEKHCNFLINHGLATSADIEELGEMVRAKVKAKSGVELEWEIKRIGRPITGKK
jgi:UDP-N-acetylmuramate dehydrogenase